MEDEDELLFTESQSKTISIATRVAACISFFCAVSIAAKAFRRRRRLFHRLMLGLSIHLLVYSCWYMYGTAAVPVGTPGIWNARGTIQTCTAQGFFLQISFCIPIYYASLSLYSLEAVRHNFDVSKYEWIEKWIHLSVHLFPVGSALYLLKLEAFNPSGHHLCWIDSIPFGCGEITGVECERGPQNIEQVALIFAGIPAFLVLLVPTVIMVALYILVRRKSLADIVLPAITNPNNPLLSPTMVAKQAGVYLLGAYWTYLWAIVNNGLQWIGNTKVFGTALLATVNLNLIGVWILLVYRYFEIVIPKIPPDELERSTTSSAGAGAATMATQEPPLVEEPKDDPPNNKTNNNKSTGGGSSSRRSSLSAEQGADNSSLPESAEALPTTMPATTTTTTTTSSILKNASSAGRLFLKVGDASHVVETGSGTTASSSSTTFPRRNHDNAILTERASNMGRPLWSRIRIRIRSRPRSRDAASNGNHRSRGSSSPARASAFNIFDGTNPSAAFSEFIFEGDSEDEDEEQQESVLWSQVQTHV